MGHSHEQFPREGERSLFVNPGSVGRPSDGNPQAAYAILNFNPFKVELIRLDYDVEAAADALRKKGLPKASRRCCFAEYLLTQSSKKKGKARRNAQKCQGNVEASKRIAEEYWQDTEHYRQVTSLALGFFDGLVSCINWASGSDAGLNALQFCMTLAYPEAERAP